MLDLAKYFYKMAAKAGFSCGEVGMKFSKEEKDGYAKDGGPGVVSLLCSFYHKPLRSLIVKEVQLLCHLISYWFQLRIETQWSHLKLTYEF